MKNKKLTLLLANMGIVIASQVSLAKVDSEERKLDVQIKSLPQVLKNSDKVFSKGKQILRELQVGPKQSKNTNSQRFRNNGSCVTNSAC